MRISTEMAKAINEQISYEASSANTYIAIGSWYERIGYDGSAAFFEQAAEENGHMLKFIHYLNSIGAESIIPAIVWPEKYLVILHTRFVSNLYSLHYLLFTNECRKPSVSIIRPN
jgi:ferritin